MLRRKLRVEELLQEEDVLEVGPAPHTRKKPIPTATRESDELTPGSPEETALRETGSTYKPDELEP